MKKSGESIVVRKACRAMCSPGIILTLVSQKQKKLRTGRKF
jgi:hypothetical protein